MAESNLYYRTVKKELSAWEKQMTKKPSVTNLTAKKVQAKIHGIVPGKVQDLITGSIKSVAETILHGSYLLTPTKTNLNPTLAQSDYLVTQAYGAYYKMALAQGIGFGLGGVLINLADLPTLMSIKVKFLFDCAKLYGFDVSKKSERIFMLYVFQLAFCSDQRRLEIYPIIKNWDDNAERAKMDWEKLQIEYRDYMDIAKLLQLLPVVGAVAGGAANHGLMKKLKVAAMNCYRLRVIAPRQTQEAFANK